VPWEPLSAEQLEIRELVRTLARERIAPRAAEIDESHEFPWDVVELFREHGLFGLFFDQEYGGLGTGTLLSLVAMEPPHLFEPNEVRNEKTKVIRSLRPFSAATVAANTVRGQYSAGSSGGVPAPRKLRPASIRIAEAPT